ncbi:MAG: hypothetical protein H0U29_13780 [Acidimicrobiia bacterium]|nr:hypothetical protein [Acidimicrobiia bacterium]
MLSQLDRQDEQVHPLAELPVAGRMAVRPRHWLAVAFSLLVAFETFHQFEHTLEVVQLKLMGAHHAFTLFGAHVNTEWAHFIANTTVLVWIGFVLVGAGPAVRRSWRAGQPLGWHALLAALAVQSYHVVEHTVRLVQHLTPGGGRLGILTRVFDPAWVHFSFNLVVLTGLVVAFAGLEVAKSLTGRLTGARPGSG